MSDWLQFLAQQPPTGQSTAGSNGAFFCALTDLGVISVSGDDAARFLHNQLTNDVEHLLPTEARLAGYCTPKGRLLATLLMWRSEETILLQLARELLPAIQKRLQMFVMRAKATLHDVSDERISIGLCGNAVATALAPWFPQLPLSPYAVVENIAGTVIRVSDSAAVPRYQWVTTAQVAIAAWPTLCASLNLSNIEQWRLTEILAGVPHITLPTQEKFVPQMVNLEAIGGVNFKKGCYPGQEIVARSQYLGKLKRRMLPASIGGVNASAGMEVFAIDDADQPCGMVVNAARAADGKTYCLIEIKTAALDAGTIHLGAGGPPLHFSELPYTLPDTV